MRGSIGISLLPSWKCKRLVTSGAPREHGKWTRSRSKGGCVCGHKISTSDFQMHSRALSFSSFDTRISFLGIYG